MAGSMPAQKPAKRLYALRNAGPSPRGFSFDLTSCSPRCQTLYFSALEKARQEVRPSGIPIQKSMAAGSCNGCLSGK